MQSNFLTDETTKQRSLRIPLLYHRSWDATRLGKLVLSALCAAGAAAYVWWAVAGSAAGRMQASHGPVASVHATWDSQCSVCHQDFTSIREDSGGVRQLNGLLGLHGQAAVDAQCADCHRKQTARHQDNQRIEDEVGCAACHRDHRGRDADIARPEVARCTACHENIALHVAEGKAKPTIGNVTQFNADSHKTFRSLASDPGKINFNHRLHLLPGQIRNSYRKPSAGEPPLPTKQLECASCHALDASPPATGAAPSAGAYMLPISFDRHCRECHPLTIPGESKSVRHGLKMKELREAVVGAIAPEINFKFSPSQPRLLIPGKDLGQSEAHAAAQNVAAEAEGKLNSLYSARCLYCHKRAGEKSESQKGETRKPADVAASEIPTVWLKHARFDHSAHRLVKCKECHAAKDAEASEKELDPSNLWPEKSDAVMIPSVAVCVNCHAPPVVTTKGALQGGARFDCAECHRYHQGTPPSNSSKVKGR